MITYDLIVVAKTMDSKTRFLTDQTIRTCIATKGQNRVNVILVETSGKITKYKGVSQYIDYRGEFRYNRALNTGLVYRFGDVQMLANNDLIFKDGWSNTGELMLNNDILSASLLSDDPRQRIFKQGMHAYTGYTIGLQMSGWLIFTQNKLWNIIGKLPENQKFSYSDNDYCDTLKDHKIQHHLLCHAKVLHVAHGSNTLRRVDGNLRNDYGIGDALTYKARRDARTKK